MNQIFEAQNKLAENLNRLGRSTGPAARKLRRNILWPAKMALLAQISAEACPIRVQMEAELLAEYQQQLIEKEMAIEQAKLASERLKFNAAIGGE